MIKYAGAAFINAAKVPIKAANSPANNSPLTPIGTKFCIANGNIISKSRISFDFNSGIKYTRAKTVSPVIIRYLGINKTRGVNPLILAASDGVLADRIRCIS